MRIGLAEALVILVAAIALIKPEELSKYSKRIAAFIKDIKQQKNEIEEVLEDADSSVK